ncbi:MAG: hypothetical protein KAS77_03870, partial [Thermoplasmata archaeon]|nr:hypothetical protein [Thermoplasmata archaeon]
HQIKLAVAPEIGVTAPITLEVAEGGELEIRRADGSLAVTDVWLIPIVMHAPDQAFINLSGECIYECAFCNTHKMEPGKRKIISPTDGWRWWPRPTRSDPSTPWPSPVWPHPTTKR